MELEIERLGIEKKFFELCTKVVSENNLELYDMSYIVGNHTLRLFIQDPKTGSAEIEDCATIDRALTPYIEEEIWMPSQLTLEVSSPGVYRKLRTREHFISSKGERITLRLNKKFDNEIKEFKPFRGQTKVTAELVDVVDNVLILSRKQAQVELGLDIVKSAQRDPVL